VATVASYHEMLLLLSSTENIFSRNGAKMEDHLPAKVNPSKRENSAGYYLKCRIQHLFSYCVYCRQAGPIQDDDIASRLNKVRQQSMMFLSPLKLEPVNLIS